MEILSNVIIVFTHPKAFLKLLSGKGPPDRHTFNDFRTAPFNAPCSEESRLQPVAAWRALLVVSRGRRTVLQTKVHREAVHGPRIQNKHHPRWVIIGRIILNVFENHFLISCFIPWAVNETTNSKQITSISNSMLLATLHVSYHNLMNVYLQLDGFVSQHSVCFRGSSKNWSGWVSASDW